MRVEAMSNHTSFVSKLGALIGAMLSLFCLVCFSVVLMLREGKIAVAAGVVPSFKIGPAITGRNVL